MNSITPETFYELRDITAAIRDNRDIWAVLLRGAGQHFSVGVDVSIIGEMIGQDKTAYRASLQELQAVLDAFEALPQPTIASIQGYCIGGAFLLALCCDFRIAASSARFSFPEVKRGIAVIMGTHRITRVAGLAITKELTMLGRMVDADAAKAYRLVNQVAPDVVLEHISLQFAGQFRKLPPRTVSAIKRIADEGYGMPLSQSQALEIDLQADLLDSADFKEAVDSFFEKRPPQFTGE